MPHTGCPPQPLLLCSNYSFFSSAARAPFEASKYAKRQAPIATLLECATCCCLRTLGAWRVSLLSLKRITLDITMPVLVPVMTAHVGAQPSATRCAQRQASITLSLERSNHAGYAELTGGGIDHARQCNVQSMADAQASSGAAAAWPATGTIFNVAEPIRHGSAARPQPLTAAASAIINVQRTARAMRRRAAQPRRGMWCARIMLSRRWCCPRSPAGTLSVERSAAPPLADIDCTTLKQETGSVG